MKPQLHFILLMVDIDCVELGGIALDGDKPRVERKQ